MGLWYEQARIPSWFESSDMSNVTARYGLLSDGSIQVINSGSLPLGLTSNVVGKAKIDPTRQGTLRVSFFPGIASDYIVLAHGKNNYDYAVVGSKDRSLIWFLTRNPQASRNQMKQMFQVARDNGYNINSIQLTPRST